MEAEDERCEQIPAEEKDKTPKTTLLFIFATRTENAKAAKKRKTVLPEDKLYLCGSPRSIRKETAWSCDARNCFYVPHREIRGRFSRIFIQNK